jgi:hypothetical protein
MDARQLYSGMILLQRFVNHPRIYTIMKKILMIP